MHEKSIGKLYSTLGVVVASAILLQGCLAAAIPLAIGAQAFTTYKTIQLTTGDGEVQIGFERETYTPEEKASLAQIHSMAIMPLSADDTALEVAMAEAFTTSGAFQVVTPSKVLQSRSTSVGSVNFDALTSSEKSDVIRKLCTELDADGLVYARLVGSEVSTNTWSFSRPNAVFKVEMNIFSRQADRVIVIDNISAKIVVGGNSNMADMREADRVLGVAMAERIQSALQ